ncbi:hypothetical protein HNP84_009919 [Thermocatellispora tengchongensis]|uniref:Uncharacterized protein n=1 Tax=Thermocatellispora tengchongensis TaxID=1073253 RepID=A0A840PM50_9ACTN|nr:hypothetical protein [Thermocatellispora tengchongensis]MBB5140152.1 hypothetical protein [Thermocatellispora tengchongensis]
MSRARQILTAMAGGAVVTLAVLGPTSTAAASTATAGRETAATSAAAWEFYSSYYTRNDCVQVGRDGQSAGWWDLYRCDFIRGDRWDLYVQR